MSTSKLTIVAQLRDELSAPLKKVIKGLDEAADAAAKGAVSADRQADAFNRLAREAGWTQNRMGKWVNESNRLISKSDRAALGIQALSLATHEAAVATKRQEEAFRQVVHAAGYKIASDGSVRNALGLFVKAQDVAIMRTMAAKNATAMAAAGSRDYGEEAINTARHTRLMNEAFKLTVESLGYSYNAQGKLVNSLGRVVSATEIAEHRADANRWATHRMGQTAEQAANEMGRAGEKVDHFSSRAINAGSAVDRFARSIGLSDDSARALGNSLANAMNSGQLSSGVREFKAKLDDIYEHAQGVASKIESVMSKALKVSTVAAGVGAAYAINGGMERLNALEQADVKLAVQDFTPEQREGIKNEVDQMVRGTFLTLPQALDTAQGLLGSGVELGPEFTEYMGTMVDAQSIYSSHDPKQLELVMRQIESKEILTGEERNQLAELGMPVNEWVAQEMGIEQSEVMDKIESKEVTSDVWWKAMRRGVEGGAEMMGKTFTGSWLNFLAAVKRSGQYFMEPILEPMRRGLNLMSDILDDNVDFFTRLGTAASVGMSEAADTIPQVLAALKPLGPSIIRLVDAIGPLLPQLVQGLANWLQVMTPLIIALIEFTTILLEIAGPLLPVLIPLLFGMLTVLRGYGILKSIIDNWDKWGKLLGKTGWIVNGLQWGFGLLSRAVMMFPGTWLVIAILGIIAVMGELYDNVEWIRNAFDAVTDSIRTLIGWFDDLIGKADDWISKKLGIENNGSINDVDHDAWMPEWAQRMQTNAEQVFGVGDDAIPGQGMFRFFQGSASRPEEPVDQLDASMSPDEGPFSDMLDPGKAVPLPGPADQAVPGLADGGFTSNGTINVGERGREFITSAWATNQVETNTPGAMQYINDTGQLPPTGGITINAPVNISGVNDPETIRAIVMAAIADAAREAEREYMNISVRGAG